MLRDQTAALAVKDQYSCVSQTALAVKGKHFCVQGTALEIKGQHPYRCPQATQPENRKLLNCYDWFTVTSWHFLRKKISSKNDNNMDIISENYVNWHTDMY